MFAHILGHREILSYLESTLRTQKLPHALLFSGPAGVGKQLVAKTVAAHLLHTSVEAIEKGSAVDYHASFPESKAALHTIEQIRLLIDEVHMAAFCPFGKVFVIHDADRMQPAAANALLKTLEEPTPDTTLILIAENPQELLPTIRSRCVYLPFRPLTTSDVATFLRLKNLPEHTAVLAQGSLERALSMQTHLDVEKKLFSWLSSRMPYHEIEMLKLPEFEDPIEQVRFAEHLFSLVVMWYRDQHLRRIKSENSPLFFPQEASVTFDLPSMEKVLQKIEEARLGFSRNIKLAACLQHILQ
jgi:DNA polymerase-3 subunit delta'